MDALILLGAASGLPPLLPVGDGDQGVTGPIFTNGFNRNR
jgi:hypothetical protein